MARARVTTSKPGILAIDIGGSGLKAGLLDDDGTMRGERVRVPTPHPCPPQLLVDTLAGLVQNVGPFDRISVGFPGVVRDGCVVTAPNLDTSSWAGFKLADAMSSRLGGHPVKLVNDAEMQGMALIRGQGIEIAITLGTGFGTALFRDGEVMPHIEIAHHPMRHDKTYEDYLGADGLKRIGKKRWNKQLRRALDLLTALLHPDHIVLGGGNARHVDADLPACVSIGSNIAGIEGGAALWRIKPSHAAA